MFRYGILSTASIIDRFIAGIRETAKKAAKRLNIENYYGSYDELLCANNIDIVYIPTVNSQHYENCKKALKHHKHVIVEKPFALTVLEAKELFTLAKKIIVF